MRKSHAAIGTSVFLFVGPGTVVGLVPWLITGWRLGPAPGWVRGIGVLLVVLGVGVLLHAFFRFVVEGFGTPAPAAPPSHLVVGGLYRHVRNPMYVALVLAIVGQVMLLGRPGLLWWAAAVLLLTAIFVRVYEEPKLRRMFGQEYETYRRAVPAWFPRLRP